MKEEQNLQKLKDILDIVELDKITVDEFEELFTMFLKVVQELKTQLEQAMGDTKNEVTTAMKEASGTFNEVEQRIQYIIDNAEGTSQSQIKELSQRLTTELNRIEQAIPELPDLSHIQQRISEVERKIPAPDTTLLKKTISLEEQLQVLKNEVKNLPPPTPQAVGSGLRPIRVLNNGDEVSGNVMEINFVNPTDITTVGKMGRRVDITLPSGGPFLVVASSTASADVIAQADYVCDGTADDVQIQAAIDTGYDVQLSSGTFFIATAIVFDNSFQTLRGAGWSTILKAVTNLNSYIISFDNTAFINSATLRDFKIDGNKTNQSGTAGGIDAKGATICIFDKLWFISCKNISLNISGRSDSSFGSNNCVTNCQFSTGGTEGIHITTNDENKIQGCVFSDFSTQAIYDGTGAQLIQGNVFVNGGIHILLQDCSNTKIEGNFLDSPGEHGIKVIGSSSSIINNNISLPGETTANTYSGIYLAFGSDNTVQGNYIKTHGTAGQTKAFIEETNTQSNNHFTDNYFMLGGSVGTSTVVANGTGSQWLNNFGYNTHNIPGTLVTTGDISVPDEAYGSGWNASLEVPTKNAVYDQVEALPAATQTFTNKRIDPRTNTITSSATPTPAGDTTDIFTVTAQAEAAAFAAPTGTPVNGQKLIIRIKDNATARALTWNAIYRAGTDVSLPTTTVLSKTLYLGFVYNSTDSKWDLLAKADGF